MTARLPAIRESAKLASEIGAGKQHSQDVKPRVSGVNGSEMASTKPREYPIGFEENTRQDDGVETNLPARYVLDGLL
jgi:hypothetical protein